VGADVLHDALPVVALDDGEDAHLRRAGPPPLQRLADGLHQVLYLPPHLRLAVVDVDAVIVQVEGHHLEAGEGLEDPRDQSVLLIARGTDDHHIGGHFLDAGEGLGGNVAAADDLQPWLFPQERLHALGEERVSGEDEHATGGHTDRRSVTDRLS
jgi:hypothetical protein